MTGLIQNIRYGVRGLLRSPGFTALAIVTLALGIGATTIVYSLVDGILLKPLPVRDPDRVVLARETSTDGEEFSGAWPTSSTSASARDRSRGSPHGADCRRISPASISPAAS